MKMINRLRRTLVPFFVLLVFAVSLSPGRAATVLLMSGADGISVTQTFVALTNGGHTVTPGPPPCDPGGTPDLEQFDAVVILNSTDWMTCGGRMPLDRVTALIKFVANGGGVVTSERAAWWAMNQRTNAGIEAFMPVMAVPTWNTAASTTYTQDTPDDILNDSLSGSLTFDLRNVSGLSESSFDARSDATVFYRSSNGGGRADSPAVVGWGFLNGKVLSFSSHITGTELASDDFKQLLVNAVNWVARSAK